MPTIPRAASPLARRFRGVRLLQALAVAGALLPADAHAQRPEAAIILERLCADTLRTNEEDRLYGLISLTVRATIKYRGGVFSPDAIDDSVQDALEAIVGACPRLAATGDAYRLGMAVDLIRNATLKRLDDPKAQYSHGEIEAATAADLSQELSAPEIDAWLDALPPRQRALALFLYASDVSREDVARAVGVPSASLAAAFRSVKADLLQFLRQEWEAPPPPARASGKAIEYREAGQPLAALLGAPRPPPAAAAPTQAQSPPAASPAVRVTGISSDVYAGWSLLATVTGLPADRKLELASPILLEPERPDRRRMIAVALDEISEPGEQTRRFLVKAFAIDAEREGSGVRDAFRLGNTALDNSGARQTIANRGLATIEVARCLWHDYGTGPDPGLCR